MADTPSVLNSVRARIEELARLADAGNAEAAKRLATELTREIERALDRKSGPGKPAPRAPRDEVTKCPRCTLRGFTFQKGSIREAEDGGFEALYRCTSCGHEGWREIS